jgi:hypothetical protein
MKDDPKVLARLEILKAANMHRHSHRYYRMRNINEAVQVVRHHAAVSSVILTQAGFREKRR